MQNPSRRSLCLFAILVTALATLGMGPCGGAVHVVKNGESIQDAVDAASPGDTIVVRPGHYTAPMGANAVVTVLKSGITLIGNPNAVIDATGVDYGVRVGNRQGCLLGNWSDFAIQGFTIENADNSGLLIANVDGYSATHGTYLDNEEYGPYPVCSTDGYVAFNYAAGHNDAAIYVGQSDGARIEHNRVEDSVIGIEVENTDNTEILYNVLSGNTAGVLVVVLPGLNIPATNNVLIAHNVIQDNNRENTGSGFLDLLPSGVGILNVGGDSVTIHQNEIQFNDTAGVASVANTFSLLDPRIEAFVDDLEVSDNVILGNGNDPDPVSAFPPADILYVADLVNENPPVFIPDPDPFDNCFAGNVYDTEFVQAAAAGPDATLADFPCP
jgi:parallel beta-helix repeat protein